MTIDAGVRLQMAPRFHNRVAWPDRVRLNGGIERCGSFILPRADWRRLDAGELGLLLAGDGPQAEDGVALLTIPPHLRAAWWSVAESADAAVGEGADYAGFTGALIDFLRFKQLPLPDGCRFDVVASRPGQASTRVAADGALAGLDWSGSNSAETPAWRVVSVINLGDEPTHVVFLNLARQAMAARIACALGSDADAARMLDSFCRMAPAYPLVRLRLEPGDGLWLPEAPVVYDGWTHEKREVDVVLTVRSSAAP